MPICVSSWIRKFGPADSPSASAWAASAAFSVFLRFRLIDSMLPATQPPQSRKMTRVVTSPEPRALLGVARVLIALDYV